MKKRNKKVVSRHKKELGLGPLLAMSAVFHVVVFGIFALIPASGKADTNVRKALMFNLEVVDQLGSGMGMTPKKGPVHDGIINLPDPPPKPAVVETGKEATTRKPKIKKKRNPKRKNTPDRVSDMLLDALKKINEGREGETTRPDGDPNSKNAGPEGPPGGDPCAVYRGRTARYMRRSGSVPEAVGRTAKISVSIGPSGNVTGKRLTKSTGIPHADSIALGVVPGRFAAPPPECGTVRIRVTVRFEGKKEKKMPGRKDGNNPQTRRKPRKKATVPSAVDKALRELD